MLIRTVEELDRVHTLGDTVLLDKKGLPIWASGTIYFEELNAVLPSWSAPFIGSDTSQGIVNRGPFTLIHPRRYGDEDVEKVARALCENDHDFWDIAEVREYYRPIARAALNALEEK